MRRKATFECISISVRDLSDSVCEKRVMGQENQYETGGNFYLLNYELQITVCPQPLSPLLAYP